MSRVIKFRVSEGQETIGYETINDGQWFVSDAGVDWVNGSYAGPTLKRWQFTGLQDRNGVDIYEGDVVRFHPFVERSGMQGSVEADYDGLGEVYYDTMNLQFCITTNTPNTSWEVLDTTHYEEPCIEVIGNIYERPDLLTASSERTEE